MIEPNELTKKLKAFLDHEMEGGYYQLCMTYGDGKPNKDGSMKFSNMAVSNLDGMRTPFSVFHGLMRGLEMNVKGMLEKIYGSSMKEEHKQPPQQGQYR
jgi:hypothetical protein